MKANHNCIWKAFVRQLAVFNGSKILIWKQITTENQALITELSCFQWFKDTNLKANHNSNPPYRQSIWAVFNGSKILIWKQITTTLRSCTLIQCCFQWFKDTNLKANHNKKTRRIKNHTAVFNGSKILIWKQITTNFLTLFLRFGCFQWFKDTNLKANHNGNLVLALAVSAVFNGSKILIWKQITTICLVQVKMNGCFQWFKDTNLKANHN